LKKNLLISILLAPLAAAAQAPAPSPAAPPASIAPAPTETPAPGFPAASDTVIAVDITKPSGARTPLAIPVPVAPLTPDFQTKGVEPFFRTLTSDLSGYPVFTVADPALYPKGLRPPQSREAGDMWIAAGAQYLLDTAVNPTPKGLEVEARLYDLKTLQAVLSMRYVSELAGARRVGHKLANDVVRQFTGKPGPFLSRIAFVSDRDRAKPGQPSVKEVYLMDWDGENQWRLTFHNNLSLSPDWSRDGQRVVYQSYFKGTPSLFTVGTSGTDRRELPLTSTELNSSPSFSPDGREIAFCGSVRGNPEIFVVGAGGTGLRRLTDNPAVDSTPRWAPNGRDLAFTSSRQGSPQIYFMDSEGANVRRITFAGNWNDEANFSPDGSKLAFACRNEGDFQICVHDLLSARTFQISTGTGAHENPTWSPDGAKLAWERTQDGVTQILIANSDGTAPRVVTSVGNNTSPSWSKTLE